MPMEAAPARCDGKICRPGGVRAGRSPCLPCAALHRAVAEGAWSRSARRSWASRKASSPSLSASPELGVTTFFRQGQGQGDCSPSRLSFLFPFVATLFLSTGLGTGVAPCPHDSCLLACTAFGVRGSPLHPCAHALRHCPVFEGRRETLSLSLSLSLSLFGVLPRNRWILRSVSDLVSFSMAMGCVQENHGVRENTE